MLELNAVDNYAGSGQMEGSVSGFDMAEDMEGTVQATPAMLRELTVLRKERVLHLKQIQAMGESSATLQLLVERHSGILSCSCFCSHGQQNQYRYFGPAV